MMCLLLTNKCTLALLDCCRFKNGSLDNAAGTNEGSCKVFSFGKLTSKSEQETLELFAQHYKSVLSTPGGEVTMLIVRRKRSTCCLPFVLQELTRLLVLVKLTAAAQQQPLLLHRQLRCCIA